MKKWMLGAALAGLLLAFPRDAADAARGAMLQWYQTVAPALFPFMALLPLLTCAESLQLYGTLLGPVTRRLFRLPGAAASALAVGMLAGSPAGCLAARRTAGDLTPGELERLAAACCGLSPAFLISGVGVGMLGDAALGHLLLRSQIFAQALLLTLPGPRRGEATELAPLPDADDPPIRAAVLGVLGVAGYMALFAALAGALGRLAGDRAGRVLLCLMDVTSGARVVCGLPMALPGRLVLLSALIGFGGACLLAQNLAALKGCGVNPGRFVARRCLAAALAALCTGLQLRFKWNYDVKIAPDVLKAACLCAALMALPGIFRLRKTIF